MSITFECGSCGHDYRVADDKAGKRIKCRECTEAITIPDTTPKDEWADDFDDVPAPRRRKSSKRRSRKSSGSDSPSSRKTKTLKRKKSSKGQHKAATFQVAQVIGHLFWVVPVFVTMLLIVLYFLVPGLALAICVNIAYLGGISAGVGNLWIAAIAYEDGPFGIGLVDALLSFFVFPFTLYFVGNEWEQTKFPFKNLYVAGVLCYLPAEIISRILLAEILSKLSGA